MLKGRPFEHSFRFFFNSHHVSDRMSYFPPCTGRLALLPVEWCCNTGFIKFAINFCFRVPLGVAAIPTGLVVISLGLRPKKKQWVQNTVSIHRHPYGYLC